jgi:hypothetical protein
MEKDCSRRGSCYLVALQCLQKQSDISLSTFVHRALIDTGKISIYFSTMISVQTFQPVVEVQLTAARAYFLCVVGMLFAESFIRLPPYLMSLRKSGGRT